MPWLPIERFRDRSIPKLHNLVIAKRSAFLVPKTVWSRASEALDASWDNEIDIPLIIRSGSPTEDTHNTSNAGQFTTLIARSKQEFGPALARVIAALPVANGRRLGVVFIQPLVPSRRAGVTFFDGFYYEETSALGGNQPITAGLERGDVTRGHLKRGDCRDAWLTRLQKQFGGVLDIEWAETSEAERVLLQVRPALFPVRRCETLSLANHKEILGDPPSPWMVGLLAEAGRPAMRFFAQADPRTASWEEPYAIELGERAWMNFSVFFRLMDHWGMPRTSVTEGVGGESIGPLDAKVLPGPFLRALPVFPRLLGLCLWTIARLEPRMRALDRALDQAKTLPELQRLNVSALDLSIRTNFAIMSLLSGLARLRKRLGIRPAGRLVTTEMMAEYAELAALPDRAARLEELDVWLGRHGHRGPLESDPMQPRFSELREPLRASLEPGPAPPPVSWPRSSPFRATLTRPWFFLDEIREAFRDRNMLWWQKLRARILEEARRATEAGQLDRPEAVFQLRAEDLASDPATWQAKALARQARVHAIRTIALPTTASRDVIEQALSQRQSLDSCTSTDSFQGIGLDRSKPGVAGIAVRASSLTALLSATDWPERPILVVETLEPSWAVVFPRFSAVVSELGGELSHASILLREAGIPAVVNASGAFRGIASGDNILVDPATGFVRIDHSANPLDRPSLR